MQFFAPHRRSGFIDVAVIAIIVLVSAAVAVPVTYFANKTTTENRSYATISCGGGTCPDGWSYGPDTAAPQTSCPQRAAEACAGHQAKPATTTPPPAPAAPAPTTGSCPNGQSKACGGCLVVAASPSQKKPVRLRSIASAIPILRVQAMVWLQPPDNPAAARMCSIAMASAGPRRRRAVLQSAAANP